VSQGQTDGGQTLVNPGREITAYQILSFGQPRE